MSRISLDRGSSIGNTGRSDRLGNGPARRLLFRSFPQRD
jgi:hypothetical protein